MTNGKDEKIGALGANYKTLKERIDRLETRIDGQFESVRNEIQENSFFRVKVLSVVGAMIIVSGVISSLVLQNLNGLIH